MPGGVPVATAALADGANEHCRLHAGIKKYGSLRHRLGIAAAAALSMMHKTQRF